MIRDCEHGRQVGKCADCDVAELEQENRLLRARNERLQREQDASCDGARNDKPAKHRNTMTNDLNQILTERGDRYGRFVDHARISQEMKRLIYRHLDARNQDLDDDQLEALEMICHKVARIINGDPDYSDSWRDVAGYAALVADRLDGVTR